MKHYIIIFLFLPIINLAQFQKKDTLWGSDTAYRSFWNVKKYEITVEADPTKKIVSGENKITFEILEDTVNPTFQIDLQEPMEFQIVKTSLKKPKIKREGQFIFITTHKNWKKGEKGFFQISFSGKPKIAQNAPWDGGWVFSKDSNNKPFMSVAQQGSGTSLWLPMKDIWNDEPDDGIKMKIITPKDLVGVGNGKLVSQKLKKNKIEWTWEVKNPINGYSIVPNIGDYANFKDNYKGEIGTLSLDYWVLKENLEKAKKQFQQVKPMLEAFEYWFGPYPFYEDGYKLVEVPYLGMEHQSSVAYGNGYQNGYKGTDLSGTGVGLLWDFILVHESGHEWFANSITAKDQADMWIHEAFTCYSETLFIEQFLDKKSADIYLQGLRRNIQNDKPIIGKYGVRDHGSGDMYYKGASMLHTIRQVIDHDEKFRKILRGLQEKFRHQTVTTSQIENYISELAQIDFSSIFNQYLRTTQIPILEYQQKENSLYFRYQNTVKDFYLPIILNENYTISPTEEWQKIELIEVEKISWDKNYFVNFRKID